MALARLDPRKHAETIRAAQHEAGGAIERVFSSLGMLLVDPTSWDTLQEQLRLDLSTEIFPLRARSPGDVLQVLASIENESAFELAQAWRPFLYPSALGG